MIKGADRDVVERVRLVGSVLVCLVVLSGTYGRTLGQPAPHPSIDEFQQIVLPVIARNCFSCHSDRLKTGGLTLEAMRDADVARQQRDVWVRVLDRLKTGTMPPRSMPPVPATDAAAVSAWITKTFGAAPAEAGVADIDPGRVTARRLNRTEYNNTIRDLLGVSIRPADQFPMDDSGYGFDNIGDVLSLSPLLMEKYVAAARVVSRAAVFGEASPAEPTRLVRFMTKKIQDDLPASGEITPFSARGALYTTFHAPVDAEYEFRLRYQNYRGGEPVIQADAPRLVAVAPQTPATAKPAPPPTPPAARGRGGPPKPLTDEERQARYERACAAAPPEPLVFTVDGNTVYSYNVRGTTDCEYTRGESVVRVKLTAGDHALRASFPGLANIPDPRAQFNPDGRRKLYVDYLDVLGPYNPSPDPPPGHQRIFTCASASSPPCTRQIIENLATRAYRRPATPQEIQKLVALVDQVRRNEPFEEAIRVALQAILTSPNFLFRIERDPSDATAAYFVSDYELASRLSYFLWSSMPDDELFDLARQKKLRAPAALNAQIQRMLRDPRSSALAQNFGEQWLNLRLMDRTKPDAAKFPAIDDELLDAMRQETRRFVDAIVRENRSILDFVDGRFTYLNGPLARYYGIPGVDGEHLRRVELTGDERSGIVTQGAILTISSYATRTSPVLRGKWVLDTLLGAAPPPPPDDVPALVEHDLGTAASMRQRLEQHRANPSCAACHAAMDPIGFGLENYDAAGAWRAKEGAFDIDSSGTLPDGRSFSGASGLKQILRAQSHAFTQNFTEKLLTYALGRGLERSDRAVVDQISGEVARDGAKFSALVTAIVNSRPFQMRTRSGAHP